MNPIQPRFGTHGCLEACATCQQGCPICHPCDWSKHKATDSKTPEIGGINPDPKAQLIERIRTIWAGNIVRHEMFDELASAWLEDVEKAEIKGRLSESRRIEAEIAFMFGNDAHKIRGTQIYRVAANIMRRNKKYLAALINKSKEQ